MVYLEHADRAEPLTKQERYSLVAAQLMATHPPYALMKIQIETEVGDLRILMSEDHGPLFSSWMQAFRTRVQEGFSRIIDEEWARIDRAMKGEI